MTFIMTRLRWASSVASVRAFTRIVPTCALCGRERRPACPPGSSTREVVGWNERKVRGGGMRGRSTLCPGCVGSEKTELHKQRNPESVPQIHVAHPMRHLLYGSGVLDTDMVTAKQARAQAVKESGRGGPKYLAKKKERSVHLTEISRLRDMRTA